MCLLLLRKGQIVTNSTIKLLFDNIQTIVTNRRLFKISPIISKTSRCPKVNPGDKERTEGDRLINLGVFLLLLLLVKSYLIIIISLFVPLLLFLQAIADFGLTIQICLNRFLNE